MKDKQKDEDVVLSALAEALSGMTVFVLFESHIEFGHTFRSAQGVALTGEDAERWVSMKSPSSPVHRYYEGIKIRNYFKEHAKRKLENATVRAETAEAEVKRIKEALAEVTKIK